MKDSISYELAKLVTPEGAALLLMMDKVATSQPPQSESEAVEKLTAGFNHYSGLYDEASAMIKECAKVLDEQLGAPKEGESYQLNIRVLSAAIGCRKWLENEGKLNGWRVPKKGDKIRTLPHDGSRTSAKPNETYQVYYLTTWYDSEGVAQVAIYTTPDTAGLSHMIPLSICEPAE